MNNPKFYIYGVPDGFNMLSGTPDEILYYQLFYDTSKRGREMRINRKTNGETVYSYLIYNLVSCKGREGAFLGMSIVFTGDEYCNNPVSLKELFDGVYNEIILKSDDKDKIISSINGANAIGRFCISRFDERQGMCEKIGRIIINNVIGELADSISTIDDSFNNSKEGRMLTLPFDADDISISQALRSYTWVSLSSECKATPVSSQQSNYPKTPGHKKTYPIADSQDLLSVHFINELTNKVGSHKDFIIQGLKGRVSIDDIMAKREEINHYLNTIEEYIGRQPVLRKLRDDYMSIYNELDNLKPQQSTTTHTEMYTHFPVDDDKNNDWFKTFIQKNPKKIIAGACAVLLLFIVLSVVGLLLSDDSKSTSKYDKTDETERNLYNDTKGLSKAIGEGVNGEKGNDDNFKYKEFYGFLNSYNFNTAWNMLQNVQGDKKVGLKLTLQISYNKWFKEEVDNRNSIDDLLKLKDIIKNYVAFNDFNENHIKFIENKIDKLKINNKKGTENKTGTGTSGVMIYHATDDYKYKKENAISAKDGKITCKRNSCFVIEGTNKLLRKDNGLEVDPNNNHLNIRATEVGSKQLELADSIVYTFNVTN